MQIPTSPRGTIDCTVLLWSHNEKAWERNAVVYTLEENCRLFQKNLGTASRFVDPLAGI